MDPIIRSVYLRKLTRGFINRNGRLVKKAQVKVTGLGKFLKQYRVKGIE